MPNCGRLDMLLACRRKLTLYLARRATPQFSLGNKCSVSSKRPKALSSFNVLFARKKSYIWIRIALFMWPAVCLGLILARLLRLLHWPWIVVLAPLWVPASLFSLLLLGAMWVDKLNAQRYYFGCRTSSDRKSQLSTSNAGQHQRSKLLYTYEWSLLIILRAADALRK
jgi:hypothetical protein